MLVLEEDAFLDSTSAERMLQLSKDLVHILDWSLLMLESGHITTSGEWHEIGILATTCNSQLQKKPITTKDLKNKMCIWMGTRGYLLRYTGAQILLQHATRPLIVQVDALMSLVAAFYPEFKMFWLVCLLIYFFKLN